MSLSRLNAKKAAAMQAREMISPSKPVSLARLEAKREAKETSPEQYAEYADIKRITSMAVVAALTDEEHEEYCRENILVNAHNNGFRFFRTQSNGLYSFEVHNGLFGPIGVGWGKTLLMLACAGKAFSRGARKALLLIPPEVLGQLVETDIPWARTKIPIPYQIHLMGGRDIRARRQIASSNRPGLYVFPYSLLSTVDTDDNLDDISPEVILGDEAHRIAKRSAARTKRIFRILEDPKKSLECAFVSGTITSKTVRDYYHIARSALRENCPLPLSASLAQEWAVIIDAEQSGWEKDEGVTGNTGPLLPLVTWAKKNFPDEMGDFDESKAAFRRAYRLRLNSSPGVVASGDSDIGTSLILGNAPIHNHKLEPGWDKVDFFLKKLREQWLTPNGDEIEHAIHLWKWEYELSAGFYNELVWPTMEQLAERRKLTEPEAESLLLRAKEHHELSQIYAKMLRMWIEEYAKPQLDTPMLIGADMSRHGSKHVGEELYGAWCEMKSAEFEGMPQRDKRAIRLCPFKINAAIDYAVGVKAGCIIWHHHNCIGSWLHEELGKRKIPHLYCPAGANDELLKIQNKDRIVVASITAHGTGKNLQHFEHQCVVQWPRPARTAEQMLGRLHRNGQKADEIVCMRFDTLEHDRLNFAACLNDALYIHQTTGVRQKMIYAAYNPLPQIFPPAVLKQRGAEGVKMLSEEQQKYLKERFGQSE